MKKLFLILTLIFLSTQVFSQIDSSFFKRISVDTSFNILNMDATYNRPFLGIGKSPVSVGGYIEAQYQYLGEDGITDGHSFAIPRTTLFIASSIHHRIKFLSEIEFEEGGEEVAIEFAALDIIFHPLLNLRGGIIMNPIGAFNQNHDGPKWEFIDRPISATQMLSATWSNPGFGLYGKYYNKKWAFGYELYLTNGFDDSIIDNTENKTYLPASKQNKGRFDESSNGEPLITSKIASKYNDMVELGLSYMGGIYNTHTVDGLVLNEKQRLDVFAIDFNTTLPRINTKFVGEWSWVFIDVPKSYTQQYGAKQYGGFLDIIQPILKRRVLGFANSTVNLALRLEYVDWNVGVFNETNTNIGDEIIAFVPAISFRPVEQTVIRLNYRFMSQVDILGNPPSKIGGVQFGISSYF